MKIHVKIVGYLIYHAGFSEKELEISQPITAENLLSLINLKKEMPKIMTRNGKAISSSDKLKNEDRVVIAPLYSGG